MDFPTFFSSLPDLDQFMFPIIYDPRLSNFAQGALIPLEVVKGIL